MAVIGSVEPWNTRESATLGALAQYWGVAYHAPLDAEPIIPMTSDTPDLIGGRDLSEPVISLCDVALALAHLSFAQVMILRHRVVDRDSPHGIAQRQELSLSEVHDQIHDALQTLIRILFADFDAGQPPYVSGPAIRRVKRPETQWQDEPPTVYVKPSRGGQSAKLNRRIAAAVHARLHCSEVKG